jgi:nucleotide-binding universal stress UspA family protein
MTVLACVDLSPITPAVVACGAELARALATELVLLHVAPPDPDFVGYAAGPQSVRDQVAARLREEHRELEAHARALEDGSLAVQPLMIQGSTADGILTQAQKLGARLIVLGSHGHGKLHDLLVGSVTDAVLRRAAVPVVIVPARASQAD